MEKMILIAAALVAGSLFAQEYKIDFNAKNPWAMIRNHKSRLEIKHTTLEGKKATVISRKQAEIKEKTDTAWALVSQRFPVAGKKNLSFSFSLRMPVNAVARGNGGSYQTAVHFYGKNGKPLKPAFIPCKVPVGTGKFMTVKGSAAIPADAAYATVQTGCDLPDVNGKAIHAVADFVWQVK